MAAGQITAAVIALASIRIYTEILGPSNYGIAMLALGAILLIDGLGVVALSQTIMARCGLEADGDRRFDLAAGLAWRFWKWALPIALIASALVSITVLLISGRTAWLLLPAMLGFYVSAETVKASLINLLILDRRFGIHSLWVASESLLTMVGVVTSLLFWQPDALSFLLGFTASRLVCTMIFATVTAPGPPLRASRPPTPDELKQAVAYGGPISLMGPLGWASAYLDRYIMGAALGASAAGIYVAAVGLVSRPYALTSAVLTNYFRPQLFNTQPAARGVTARVLKRWLACSFGIGLAGTLTLALVSDRVVALLLAPEFRDGAPLLLVILALAQTFAVMTHAADNAILAKGRSRHLLRLQIALGTLTLTLLPLGVAVAGMTGGAVARLLSEILKWFVVTTAALRSHRADSGATDDKTDETGGSDA